MCGGRGTRLDGRTEKPLYEIDGHPMIDRVCDALAASRIETMYPVVSPHTPRTREHLDGRVIEAPGEGYVTDLQYALERTDSPVLTVAADLPLLAGDTIDTVLDRNENASLTVCVPAALKRLLGVSIDTTMECNGREVAPTGVNIVAGGGTENMFVTYDARFAVNVNRPSDVHIVEELI
ncbi:MAG TPA: NTP transferase domain-containing protein [Halococcus sp.]|nr:NTP transferase domain-containing protein [Halococcus sp.]